MKTIFTTNQLTRCIKNQFLSVGPIFTRNLSRGLPKFNLNPVVSFDNSEEQKETIFKTCKGKSFVKTDCHIYMASPFIRMGT